MAKRSSQTKQQDSSKSREESSHSSLRDNSDVECGGRAGGGSQGGAEDKKGHIMDDDQVNAFLIRMPAWLVPSLSIPSIPVFSALDQPRLGDLYHCRRRLLLQKSQVAFQAAGRILFQGDSSLPFLSWLSLTEQGSALCCGLCGKAERLRASQRVSITLLSLGTTSGL